MLAEGKDVEAGPVFVGPKGAYVNQSNFQRDSWRPALKRAGLKGFRFYDCRHTAASLLLAAGVSLRVVADRLGHENPATTLKFYAAALPDQQELAAQAIDGLYNTARNVSGDGSPSDRPPDVPQSLVALDGQAA